MACTFSVTVLEASSLTTKDKTDSFVKISCGSISFKTDVVKNSNDPKWNQVFAFNSKLVNIHRAKSKYLNVEVHQDSLLSSTILGIAKLNLIRLRGKNVHSGSAYVKEKSLDLESKDGKKSGGKIKIKVEMKRLDDSMNAAKYCRQVLKDTRASSSLFTDPDFPADAASLWKDPSQHKETFTWKRLSELTNDPAVFKDGSGCGDVIQGGIGDCYLLGALSVMAMREELVRTLFTANYVKYGLFQCRIFKNGAWHVVTIDDYVPMRSDGKTPQMARCKDPSELWVPLLEKAYAKLHGCYESLDLGSTGNAFSDLTGEAPESFKIASHTKDDAEKKKFWNLLLEWEKEKYLMSCSMHAKGASIEEDRGMGILAGHAYGVLRVVERKHLQLICLRNPWGCKEWTGAWSDSSKEWTSELRKKLNVKVADDGEFWMCYDDFIKYFTNFFCVRMLCDAVGRKWHRCQFASEWTSKTGGGCINYRDTFLNNPQYSLAVRSETKDSAVFFELLQPDPRMKWESTLSASIGLTIFVVSDNTKRMTEIKDADIVASSSYSKDRSVVLEVTLQADKQYIVIPSTFDQGKKVDFWLTIYSKNSVVADELKSHR